MTTPSIHEYREPVKYGGFWIRVAASIIDYIVLLIPSMLLPFSNVNSRKRQPPRLIRQRKNSVFF